MKVSFEGTVQELIAAYGENCDFSEPIEMTFGKETFIFRVSLYDLRREHWQDDILIQIRAEGYSKRLQEIAAAKGLVNKTKEAHEEAQRKLSELMEGNDVRG